MGGKMDARSFDAGVAVRRHLAAGDEARKMLHKEADACARTKS
jgi:hypothetical protein